MSPLNSSAFLSALFSSWEGSGISEQNPPLPVCTCMLYDSFPILAFLQRSCNWLHQGYHSGVSSLSQLCFDPDLLFQVAQKTSAFSSECLSGQINCNCLLGSHSIYSGIAWGKKKTQNKDFKINV